MKTATLRIEAIGDDTDRLLREWEVFERALGVGDAKRPAPWWVAEITGTHPQFKLERLFLRGHKDFSESNSVGSRGVYVYFFLKEGGYFEVKERVSWRKVDRYFCTVRDGEIVRVPGEEVMAWAEEQDRKKEAEWLESKDSELTS